MEGETMAYDPIKLKKDVKAIFRDRPKLYLPPLAKKMQRTTKRAERRGPVKVYTEEEIFFYRLKTFNKTPFNFET